jgi:hypothetical protein
LENTRTLASNFYLGKYEPYETSKKALRYLDFFWLGFIIFTLGGGLSSTGHVSIKFCQIIEVPGLILMFVTAINIIQFKFSNKYLRFFYVIYFGWLLGIIFRDFSLLLSFSFIKGFFFEGIGMLYLSPLIMLFPLKLTYLKRIFDVIFISGIFYLIYNLLFIKDIISRGESSKAIVESFSELSFSSGFILLTFAYHDKKKQLIAIAAILVTILTAVMNARRGLLSMCAEIILISFLLYTYFSKKKLVIIYLTILAALAAAIYINGLYKVQSSKIFGNIIERGTEDTRTNVELYFYDDMKTKDWIIGRGIDGQYFCPDIEENQVTNYRTNIETGYLQTILKGGLISLGLFILIAVPAMIKGFFYSKNILSKAAGFWILMALVNSYPTIYEGFTLKYLLVWVSIGICYSKEIRKIKESNIRNIFRGISKEKMFSYS